MRVMAVLASVLVLVFSGLAKADILNEMFNEVTFECRVLSHTTSGDDIEGSFVWSSHKAGGSHGGDEQTLAKGDDEIVAIGNDRWMGVAWWRAGKKIGEAVTLVSSNTLSSRVLLLMHPENDEERVDIVCDKN